MIFGTDIKRLRNMFFFSSVGEEERNQRIYNKHFFRDLLIIFLQKIP